MPRAGLALADLGQGATPRLYFFFCAALSFAQRAFWKAEIRARAAALSLRFFRRPLGAAGGVAALPKMFASSFSSFSSCSLIAAARRSCAAVRSDTFIQVVKE
jgi:hypothetical protein